MSNRPRTIQLSGIPFFSRSPRLLLPVSGLALVRHRDHECLVVGKFSFFFLIFLLATRSRWPFLLDWNRLEQSTVITIISWTFYISLSLFFLRLSFFFVILHLVYFVFRLMFLLSFSLFSLGLFR